MRSNKPKSISEGYLSSDNPVAETVAMKSVFAFCLSFFLVGTAVSTFAAEELRTWSDATGKFTVVAELLDCDGAAVRLKRENGKTIKVPLEKLSSKDREYLANRERNDKDSDLDTDDDPFAGGELRRDRSGPSKDGEKTAPPDKDLTPIDTKKTVIPKLKLARWSYEPDVAPEVVLDNPVKKLVFPLDSETEQERPHWSGFHFNPANPSQVFVSVFFLTGGSTRREPCTRLFSGDTKTGEIAWTDFPRHFKLLGISPDGGKCLFLEGPVEDSHLPGAWGKIHVFRLSGSLEPTRIGGFQPFLFSSTSTGEKEEEDEDKVVLYESKTRYATAGSRGTFSSTVTYSPNVPSERKDRYGRELLSSERRGAWPEEDVAWGTWLDDDRVLLLSGGAGCLILLDTRSGEVAWSIPSGSFSESVLSPGKRYCLLRVDRSLRQLMDKKTSDAMKRMSEKKVMVSESPLIVFDMKELKLCGRLEGSGLVDSPTFSPDGKTVAASWKCAVRRWNMADGKQAAPIYYSYPYQESAMLISPNYKVDNNQERARPFQWVNDRYVKAGTVLIDTLVEAPVWRYLTPFAESQFSYGGYFWCAARNSDRSMTLHALKVPHPDVPGQDRTKPEKNPYAVSDGTPVAVRVDASVVHGRQAVRERLEKTVVENGWTLKTDADTVLAARVTHDPEKNLPRYEMDISKDGRSLWRITVHPGSSRFGASRPDPNEIARADYSLWFIGVMIPKKIRNDSTLAESGLLPPSK